MRLNVKPVTSHGHTHEGAPAAPMNAEQALRRSVMSCLLWESEFYEDGEDIAARIVRLASTLPASKVSELAIEAREREDEITKGLSTLKTRVSEAVIR